LTGSSGSMRSRKKATRRIRRAEAQAAGTGGWAEAHAEGVEAGAALHRAAAALQRSFPGKEPKSAGIGFRPSTYSAILSTIKSARTCMKLGGKFYSTEIGLVVTDSVENFRDIFRPWPYTAAGRKARRNRRRQEKWNRYVTEFYKSLRKISNMPKSIM